MAPFSVLDAMDLVVSSCETSRDVERMLVRIADTARDAIPHTDFASVVVGFDDGHLEPLAATDPVAAIADTVLCTLREGPAYDALTGAAMISCRDLTVDARWPTYGPRAVRLGIRSQLVMRIHGGPRSAVCLILHSHDRAGFRHPRQAARVLTEYAGRVLTSAGDLGAVRRALESETVRPLPGPVMELVRGGRDAVGFGGGACTNGHDVARRPALRLVAGEQES
jgi:hypothetical protein